VAAALFELVLLAPQECVEQVSDALIEQLDALSVSVEDADADSGAEQPLYGEPGLPLAPTGWNRSVLGASFASEADATRAAAWLLAQDWAQGLTLQSIAAQPEHDWVTLTQAQFPPSEIAPGFWIVPSWHQVPVDAKRFIRLDPGQAFGTGTHPTTRMCLRWIARHGDARAAWPRALDYGCGSGILAIGAALHGAGEVDAVDIDPAAVETTRANASANGVALRAGLPDAAVGTYALVLANILATPLKLLAPLLAAHVAPGGTLVLAGILERQAAELETAYAPLLSLHISDCEDGWILMTARRPGSGSVA
jgi:ribosomal protein L11 methyltransferase